MLVGGLCLSPHLEGWSRVRVDDFDYFLPEELIAQTPLSHRTDSRLMVVDPVSHSVEHLRFPQIENELRAGDVLVVNNSRVIPARLFGVKPDTKGRVEVMLTRQTGDFTWEALCRPAKRFKKGMAIDFAGGGRASVLEEGDDGMRMIAFELLESMESFLNRVGQVPLPPYIHEPLGNPERYQTVYAKPRGSVAAPTAGLHFTEDLLARLTAKGVRVVEVTLHVGIGTFRPVQVDDVEAHKMHSEWYEISPEAARELNAAKAENRRIVAVGTTAMRTLESAGQHGTIQSGAGDTAIFIYPGYQFQMVDALITNFHLPKSTLFMLVCAMMGTEFAKEAYSEAVKEQYRFFSFGDAMFIRRRDDLGA